MVDIAIIMGIIIGLHIIIIKDFHAMVISMHLLIFAALEVITQVFQVLD